MTEAAELIARLTAERDGWMRIVGQIAATVPLPLILKATGSTGDLIAHFKAQADHIETLEARVATLSAALVRIEATAKDRSEKAWYRLDMIADEAHYAAREASR